MSAPSPSARHWRSTKPDHCLLQTLPPLKHTRLDTDLEYAPARDVALPGKSSRRSTVFWIDPIDHAEKICESDLEARHNIQFTSDRRVTRIETQFGPLHYRDADGALRSTVYDSRVTYEDGLKTLVSVKVAERAALQGTDEINQRVLDYEPLEVADQAQLLTERDLPAWAASNAALIHSVRNSHHESPDIKGEGFLLRHARKLARPVSLAELCEPFGGSGQHFRAAVMLIFEGDLRQVEPGLINEATVVAVAKDVINED